MAANRGRLGQSGDGARMSPLSETSIPTGPELRLRYEQLIENGTTDYDCLEDNIKQLKELILAHGLPDDDQDTDLATTTTLRGRVWQILLRMRTVDVDEYLDLLKDGLPEVKNEVPPGSVSMFGTQAATSKDIIVVDANRTFATETLFVQQVPFEKIVRVLSAFHRKIQQIGRYMGYIQGMNAIAGCFLYNMPEVEAWTAMCIMMEKMCPRYSGLYGGSYDGDILVRRIIESVDAPLAAKLALVPLSVFTHQVIHGFCTVYPPLSEILKLWDLILAFGAHMSTIFAASMIIIRRDEILSSPNPNDFLKKNTHPNIDASALIRLAVHIIPLIPPKLFGLCAVHPWKPLSTIENLPDPFEALSDKHTKWCSKGNHYVPKSEFARSTTSLDGLQEACQKCLR